MSQGCPSDALLQLWHESVRHKGGIRCERRACAASGQQAGGSWLAALGIRTSQGRRIMADIPGAPFMTKTGHALANPLVECWFSTRIPKSGLVSVKEAS